MLVNCGQALPGHQVAIIDEGGAPVPELQLGRVMVAGPSLMSGYLNNPEATRDALTADGWLDTGDLGYMHEGNLFAAAPARLYAVDFGIIGRLGAPERRYLAEILWGFLNRDYRRVAQVHFDAGYVPAHHSVEAFAQALRAVGEVYDDFSQTSDAEVMDLLRSNRPD